MAKGWHPKSDLTSRTNPLSRTFSQASKRFPKYIGLDGVNYGTGRVAVTSNTIVGRTTRETGLSYVKGGGTALNVVSTGNLVDRVGTSLNQGTGVTVTACQ